MKLYKQLKSKLKGNTKLEYHSFKKSGAITIDKYIDPNDQVALDKILDQMCGINPLGSTQFLYETEDVEICVNTCECIVLDRCRTNKHKCKVYVSKKNKLKI